MNLPRQAVGLEGFVRNLGLAVHTAVWQEKDSLVLWGEDTFDRETAAALVGWMNAAVKVAAKLSGDGTPSNRGRIAPYKDIDLSMVSAWRQMKNKFRGRLPYQPWAINFTSRAIDEDREVFEGFLLVANPQFVPDQAQHLFRAIQSLPGDVASEHAALVVAAHGTGYRVASWVTDRDGDRYAEVPADEVRIAFDRPDRFAWRLRPFLVNEGRSDWGGIQALGQTPGSSKVIHAALESEKV